MLFMRKITSWGFIPLYLIFFVVFRTLFTLLTPLIIKDTKTTPYVIDMYVFKTCAFFKTDYYIRAKDSYDAKAYWSLYFPLDFIFPCLYGLLFLSLIDKLRNVRIYKILFVFIIAGSLFDLGENFSFGFFKISKADNLVYSVSFFSTIKTILFAFNIVASISVFLYCLIMRLIKRR